MKKWIWSGIIVLSALLILGGIPAQAQQKLFKVNTAWEPEHETFIMLDDDVPAGIRSDVTRLRQVLINLLSNAVKFTDQGEVVLTVKKGKRKNELQFTVRDTGIGISKSHMPRLFESFSQADSSTTRKFGGTGLGLAISRRLAEMMGGEMHAESEGIGHGSCFIFTIVAEPAVLAGQNYT